MGECGAFAHPPPSKDSWAICRIFKKTNSMAQRALSHSWVYSLPENNALSNIFNQGSNIVAAHFSPETISCTTEAGSTAQICNNDLHNSTSPASFSTLDHVHPFKPFANQTVPKPSLIPTSLADIPTNQMLPTIDLVGTPRSSAQVMFLNLASANYAGDVAKVSDTINFGGSQQQLHGFPVGLSQNLLSEEQLGLKKSHNQQLDAIRSSIGFQFSLPSLFSSSRNVLWDTVPCPSELSTGYSWNK